MSLRMEFKYLKQILNSKSSLLYLLLSSLEGNSLKASLSFRISLKPKFSNSLEINNIGIYVVLFLGFFMLFEKVFLLKSKYFSSHKFAFSNLRFSPFYEHFRQLREKYAFKLKIKYILLISSLRRI